MLNDYKWIRTDSGDSILYTTDNKKIATILSYGNNNYKLLFWLGKEHFDFDLECGSMEIAEWRAGLVIYDECQKILNRICKIRDHLPSPHEMYKKASPEEERRGDSYEIDNRSDK